MNGYKHDIIQLPHTMMSMHKICISQNIVMLSGEQISKIYNLAQFILNVQNNVCRIGQYVTLIHDFYIFKKSNGKQFKNVRTICIFCSV